MGRPRERAAWPVVLLLLALGCAAPQPRLMPAPEAQRVLDQPPAAAAEGSGVRLTAMTEAWSGEPSNLERIITPVKVTIENRGRQAVSIRPELFGMRTDSGFRLESLPPFAITRAGTRVREVVPDPFPHYLWPYASGYYHYGHPHGWGAGFGLSYRERESWQAALPTEAMIRQALPQGTLEPDGIASGFVYFPRLPDNTRSAAVHMNIVDAGSGESMGAVEIPFVVE